MSLPSEARAWWREAATDTKGRSHPCPSPLAKQRHAITRVLFPKWRIQRPATAQNANRPVPQALLEDKMSIENDFPPDRSYARGRN